MNTHDDNEPMKVWKRSLPDDEQLEESGSIGTVAVVIGGIIVFITAVVIGGIILFDKYKHHVGM